jgi:hypothetical protein
MVIRHPVVDQGTTIDTGKFSDLCPWKINTQDSSASAIVATPTSIYQTLVQSADLLASPTASKLVASIEHQVLFVLWGLTRD